MAAALEGERTTQYVNVRRWCDVIVIAREREENDEKKYL